MSIYTLMPLHHSLGLVVIGLDLSTPLDAETAGNLPRLLAEHLVLVFPNQALTPSQYLTAAAAFGRPMRHHCANQHMPGFPDIGMVGRRAGDHAAQAWHTGQTSRERPPAATMLYGAEIPSASGGTSVADMRAAYWALPEAERLHLETVHTVNSFDPERSDAPAADSFQHGAPVVHPSVVHPIVRTHPVSRERAVHFDPTDTTCVVGMTPEASRAYLADLMERLIQPEIVYDHSWRKGDVLVIDNCAALHRAHDDHGDGRVLWQINVEDDRPVLI